MNYRNRWILNTGISIWGLEYCPLSTKSSTQYLAIGGYKNKHANHVLGKPQFETFADDPQMAQMIQIWETSDRNPPKIVLGILHKYGCVYDLKWCPLASSNVLYHLNINGIESGSTWFSCSIIRRWLMSSIFCTESKLNNVRFIRLIIKSIFDKYVVKNLTIVSCESIFEVALSGTLLWKLDWVGPRTLVNGTTDGKNQNEIIIRSGCHMEC